MGQENSLFRQFPESAQVDDVKRAANQVSKRAGIRRFVRIAAICHERAKIQILYLDVLVNNINRIELSYIRWKAGV